MDREIALGIIEVRSKHLDYSCPKEYILESSNNKMYWEFKDISMNLITTNEIFYTNWSPKPNRDFDDWDHRLNKYFERLISRTKPRFY